MSADLEFLDVLIRGLDNSVLDWLEIRIRRIKESRNPQIISRRTIIRKE